MAATEDLLREIAALREAVQNSANPNHDAIADAVLSRITDRLPVANRRIDPTLDRDLPGLSLMQRFTDGPLNDQERAWQQAGDQVYMLSAWTGKHPSQFQSAAGRRLAQNLRKLTQAMDSTTATEGDEWVPTGFSSRLIEKVRLLYKVAALHERIQMPTNPFTIPAEGADVDVSVFTESTEDTGQTAAAAVTPLTTNITFTAVHLAARALFSKAVEEDSIIAIMPYIERKLVRAQADAEEKATINGDTTATHMDSDLETAGPANAEVAWKGYRRIALTQTADISWSSGGVSLANMRLVRAAMGVYGINPMDLAWVVGVKGYQAILGLAEVVTLEKYGSSATVLTGELARIDGIPVIVSEFVRENLNTSGVYDGSTTTKGSMSLVYRPGFAYGDRREMTLQKLVELYAIYDQDALITTRRLDFKPLYASANVVGLGYNYTA